MRAVQQVVDQDQRATVRQVAAEVNLSTGSVHNILCKDLDLKKKAPKFVPRILTAEQKALRVQVSRRNLKVSEDPLFLWTVITGDESWFSILEPEQKQKSCLWMGRGERHPHKALRSRQIRKTMMEVFFDDEGVVHLEFLPPR